MRLGIYRGERATDPAVHPRATAHVAEMLVLIQRLLDRGYAYVDHAGQVYFSVEKFPEYGRLSGKVLDELEAGARVAVREEKRDPRDFALWKVDDKHLMHWDRTGPMAGHRETTSGSSRSSLRSGSPGSIRRSGPASPAGTSSARRWRAASSATGSTCTPAARTTRSRTMSARSRRAIGALLDPAAIIGAIARRQAAKTARDFARADAIRKALHDAGVAIEDLAQGVRWKRLD
jgi:cysteinyl-tRNA synthetase